MKLFFAGLITLSASFAFACPELTGTYQCKDEDGRSSQVVVSQRVVGGVTIYKMDGEEFPADGKAKPINDGNIKGTYTVQCEGQKLRIFGEATDSGTGVVIKQNAYVYKTARGIRQDISGEVRLGDQVERTSTTMECPRK